MISLVALFIGILPQSRVEQSLTTWSGSIIGKINHHSNDFYRQVQDKNEIFENDLYQIMEIAPMQS